ncbi:MAG: PilZ domain-containing protein [Deltaproteobacteria bacterium]|nr:PilZ domain-containing protein [Deltaproteobacteria bacterium]
MASCSPMTRRHARQSLTEPVRIQLPTRPETVGILREISCSGALVVSETAFAPDERVTLLLSVGPEGSSHPERQLRGRVVRCERRAEDVQWRYAAALELDGVLAEVELAQLLPAPGSAGIRCDEPFLAKIEAHGNDGRAAMVRDLSETGAMLLTRAQLQVGERVRLTLLPSEASFAGATALLNRVVEARVARVGPCSEGSPWRCAVGVQFERPLRAGPAPATPMQAA